MSQISLKKLDERIRQTKINDLLAMNQIGEGKQLEEQAKIRNIWFLVTIGLAVLISSFFQFEGYLTDYVRVIVAIITIGVMIFSYVRGGVASMLEIALVMAINGIYQLIIVSLASGMIQGMSVILGTFQIGIALYYIQQANRYQQLQEKSISPENQQLYDDIYEALNSSEPNNSNKLIELKEMQQSILVWLRPSGVVILLKGEKRLFFDTNRSFELTIKGQDSGGDKVKVVAKIIDGVRYCLITRHGWLRYTQFKIN